MATTVRTPARADTVQRIRLFVGAALVALAVMGAALYGSHRQQQYLDSRCRDGDAAACALAGRGRTP